MRKKNDPRPSEDSTPAAERPQLPADGGDGPAAEPPRRIATGVDAGAWPSLPAKTILAACVPAIAALERLGHDGRAAAVLLRLAMLGHRRRDLGQLVVGDVVGSGSAILACVPRPRAGLRQRRRRRGHRADAVAWFDGEIGAWLARRARNEDGSTPLFPDEAFTLALDAMSREVAFSATWYDLRCSYVATLHPIAPLEGSSSPIVMEFYGAWRARARRP